MSNAALKPRPERLALLPEVELDSGAHPAPPKDCDRPEGCDREIAAWVLGQEWTDRAPWESPVLAAFRRRLNDALPVDLRQRLKDSMFDGLGTAADGRDEDRAWMITDWSVRAALPTWLELAGVEEAPAQLRALPEVTAETFGEAKPLIYKLRDEAWERRQAWRAKLREAVKAELKKRGITKAAAAVAVDVAAAVAVADAAAVAVGWRPDVYSAVYRKVKPLYEEKIGEKYRPTQTALLDSALDLIKRMSELEPVDAS